MKITEGPEWAIGAVGKYDGESITFWNHMMEPHWYSADGFKWIEWQRK